MPITGYWKVFGVRVLCLTSLFLDYYNCHTDPFPHLACRGSRGSTTNRFGRTRPWSLSSSSWPPRPPSPFCERMLKEHCGGGMGNEGGACAHSHSGEMHRGRNRERDLGRSFLMNAHRASNKDRWSHFYFFSIDFFSITVHDNTTLVGHGTRLTQP